MAARKTGKTALVTGASAGLGREYARLFAADGHDVVLVARRHDKLAALAEELRGEHGVDALVVAADLVEPTAPQAVFDTVAESGLEIEYLVNNAGFGSNGPFAEMSTVGELDMVAVNIAAVVHLTRLFLPAMLERRSGRILNVGSMAGFQAGPFMSTYYATKAFVNHFSEALSHEMHGTGVTVTVSCPGATATEFGSVSGNGKSRLFKNNVASSREVAAAAYRAMHKGKRMEVHGLRNRFLIQSLRLSPRTATHRIAARLNKLV